MRLRELFEEGTAGGTVSGSVASVPNPQAAIGNAGARKAYGRGATPKPPKAKQRKTAQGTATNALDSDNNIFGAETIKR